MTLAGKAAAGAASTVAVLWFAPLVWLVLSAFVPTTSLVGADVWRWTVENFAIAYRLKDWTAAWLSSAVTATGVTAAVLALGIPAAYALSRWPRKGRSLMGFLVASRVLPPAATIVAFLLIGASLRLLDTWAVLVFCGVLLQLGWVTALLAASLQPHAPELEEWLRSQGVSPRRAALTYVWARGRTMIGVSAALCWLFQWGEFFYATTLTGGGRSQTVTVIVAGFSTGQDIQWGPMFAACLLAVAPIIVVLVVVAQLVAATMRRADLRAWTG